MALAMITVSIFLFFLNVDTLVSFFDQFGQWNFFPHKLLHNKL